ncbi:MAG: DUF1028 domain-containing protein [Chloroflexota bacterium]|nr:MAG: DUF1028 domain-containing protein [Chloroflexota bacterium]
MTPSTFSLVAFDSTNGDLGIAVASKFLAVGAMVPWAQAGIGAIATQSWANTSYGPRGLEMLQQGMSPDEVGKTLTDADEHASQRQFGIVDAQGRAFTFTGGDCFRWAGGRIGKNYAAQGNILAGAQVVDALAETFENSTGDLAERLLIALAAGQAAGGDKRGQESAALLVVRAHGGYGGFNDRYMDLRVDDNPAPIEELKRLLALHRLYLEKSNPNDLIAIDENIARELQSVMSKRGFAIPVNGVWDEHAQKAFREFGGVENLEERLQEGPFIDTVVLKFLRERFP